MADEIVIPPTPAPGSGSLFTGGSISRGANLEELARYAVDISQTVAHNTIPTRLVDFPCLLLGWSVAEIGGSAGALVEIGTSGDTTLTAASMTNGVKHSMVVAAGGYEDCPSWACGRIYHQGVIVRTTQTGSSGRHNVAVLPLAILIDAGYREESSREVRTRTTVR